MFYEKEMNLAINICICYNAVRQKDAEIPCEQRMESPNRVPAQFGDICYWDNNMGKNGDLFSDYALIRTKNLYACVF